MIEISNTRRFCEIGFVLLTGLCKYIFVDLLPYKFWYILFTCLFWSTYVLIRRNHQKSILQYWGFTGNFFRRAIFQLLPLGLFCLTAFIIYGVSQHTMILNWHILPILILYPIWGFIQQFLIVALIAGNLNDLQRIRIPKFLIVVVTAIVFSIVHYPSAYLIASTFLLALVYSIIYLKYKNLWVLGLYHGWLGAFFYFFVLHRDAWEEIINTL